MSTTPVVTVSEDGTKTAEAHIVRNGLFSCQLCMPKICRDVDAERLVNELNPAGTTNGWMLSHRDEQRVQCQRYEGNVHMLFDC